MNYDEPLRSLSDGKVQMEGRPSSTDSTYNLGSTRLWLGPPSGPPSGSMTSSTTESTLWNSQTSCNGDSFTTSFGLCAEPKEGSVSAPPPSHEHRKRYGDIKLPNLDSKSHLAVGNGKPMNDVHLMDHIHKGLANEIWSPRSPRATAAPPRAFNYCEQPARTETLTGQGHGFVAGDFFPKTLLTPLGPKDRLTVSFRQLYEVAGVSTISKLPTEAFFTCLKSNFDDYDTLRSTLIAIMRHSGKILPERSSVKAWQSWGDRFCVIGIPAISSECLPCFLKDRHIKGIRMVDALDEKLPGGREF